MPFPFAASVRSSWYLFAVLAVATLVGGFSQFGIVRPLINDEAVELLQGTGTTLDRFHFLTPPEFYPDGHADVIETFGPYLNALLFRGWNGIDTQETFLRSVRLCFLAAYVMASGIFALAAGRLWGGIAGLAAGLAFALSSVILIVNHLVTRNGLTALWGAAAVLAIVLWLRPERDKSSDSKVLVPLFLSLILVFGCWTYTSFRLVAASVYGALAFDWLRHDRTWSGATRVVTSFAAFSLILILMVKMNDGSLAFFLNRGSYALGGPSDYLIRLGMTLASPVYYTPSSPRFLTEDVHILMGRPPMSLWLVPFMAVGFVRAFLDRCRPVQVSAICWLIGMSLCALAGPNVKYLVGFHPFALLVALFGIYRCAQFLDRTGVSRKVIAASLLALGAVFGGSELHHVFHDFAASRHHERNSNPEKLAKAAIDLAATGRKSIYLHPSQGFDIVQWQLRGFVTSGRISVHTDIESVRKQMADVPPESGTVLLVDYPPEELSTGVTGKPLPSTVTVVNVIR